MATAPTSIDESDEVVFCRNMSGRRRHEQRYSSVDSTQNFFVPTPRCASASNSCVIPDRVFPGGEKVRSSCTEREAIFLLPNQVKLEKSRIKLTHASMTTTDENDVIPKQEETGNQNTSTDSCVIQSKIPAQAPLTSIISYADGDTIVSEISGLGEEDLEAFRKEGGALQCDTIVTQTIESILSNPEDIRILRNGLSSLVNLCVDENSRTFIGNSGGIKVAIEAVQRHDQDIAIQELGMRFLARVTDAHLENKLQVGRGDGMKAILRNFSREERATSALFGVCCEALNSICHKCEFNQILAGSLKAPTLLAQGLEKWRNDVVTLGQCLVSLNTLASNSPQNAVMIYESDLGSTLVVIMEQYAAYLCIQTTCLQLCGELLRRNPLAREQLGKAGIIECIEGGLLKHAVAKKFIVLSCNCLRYLAFTAMNRQRIAECAIMPILAAGLERWKKCVDVVTSILPAFANATYDNKRNKYAVARNGGVATILSLLDIHESSVSICEYTCRVLRNISDGTVQTKRLCVREGGIAGVISTMKSHQCAEGIHEHGCAMLINLLESYSHVIKSSDVEDYLNQVVEIHSGCNRVERQVVFLQATLKRMPKTEPDMSNSRRDLWFRWLGRNVDKDNDGKLTRAASTWWFSSSRENSLVHGESLSSRGSTTLRVGNTRLDAEDILKGEEIQKAVERLSNTDTAVEY